MSSVLSPDSSFVGDERPVQVGWRVAELAAEAGISVAVLRSYQAKGLLPPPRHEGRDAWYSQAHLDRLHAIADRKARGWSLAAIAEELAAPGAPAPVGDEPVMRLRDLAQRTGVPAEMLRSLEASGLLRGRSAPDGPRYSDADARAVEAVLLLVGSGIPIDRFVDVAEVQIAAVGELADGALDLYRRHVAEPLRLAHPERGAEAEREAVEVMAAAIGRLAGYLAEREILRRSGVSLPDPGEVGSSADAVGGHR